MTSEKKVCDSCNAIADSDAKFCRECGTALPPTPTNSSALLAQAKIALARADYKGVLRACAAAKLLDPNNAEVSQIMAVAHAALDVIRDQKPGERNAAHVQDSNPHRNKSNTRKRLHWGRGVVIAVIMIIVLGIINAPNDDGIGSSSDVNTSSQPKLTQTSTPVTPTKVPVAQYEGCDGLSDLIERVKTDGMGKLGLYSVVNVGDEDICNNTIKQMNKPELLKD